MSVAKAEKAVRGLEAEKAKFESRIAELESQLDTAPVGKLGGMTAELAASRSTLSIVGDRLIPARQALKDELATVNAAKILELRKEEARLWEEAQTVLFGPLRDKMETLNDVQKSLGRLRAGVRTVGSPIVFQAIDQMRDVRARVSGDYSDHSNTGWGRRR